MSAALLPTYGLQPGAFSDLLLMTFLFAAREELGWQGFPLPRLLRRGWSAWGAALLLGLPWARLHLPLVRPGKLSVGRRPLPWQHHRQTP